MRLTAQLTAQFELSGMSMSDTYTIAGDRMRAILPALPDGLTWQLTDIDVRRLTARGAPRERHIQQLVRARMTELGLQSSRQVANRCDPPRVSHTTVNLVLSGRNRNPTLRLRRQLANSLGMPEDWLYD